MATQGSSIRGLLKTLKASLSKRKFDEVQQMLMDREIKSRIEVKDLKRDVESMKAEARQHESNHSLAVLDKLMIEEKLEKSQRTHQELNEKVESLSEELKASCDREKRAEEHHKILSNELTNTITEKVQLIIELNGKINELQGKNSEITEQLARQKQTEVVAELKLEKTQRTCLELNEKVTSLSEELKASCDREKRAEERHSELTNIITEKVRLIIELQSKNSEITEQLARRKQNEELAELKRQTVEANLEERVDSQLGSSMLNANLEDLASFAVFTDKFDTNGEKVDFPDMIKCWRDSLETDTTNADPQNAAIVPRVACATSPLVMEDGSSAQDNEASNPPRPAAAIAVAPPQNSLEAKRKRVIEGGEDAGSQYKCEMCGVMSKNIRSYITHLSSKKHASMIKKKRVL